MNKDELIAMSKKILFLDGNKEHDLFSIYEEPYRSYIENNDITFVGSRDTSIKYTSDLNRHHETTEYLYKNVFPVIANLLGFEYDLERDFFMCKNIIDGNDYSYLLPYENVIFECITSSVKDGWFVIDGAKLIGNYASFANSLYVYNGRELLNEKMQANVYTRLFSVSMETSSITNMNSNSDRVLVLSCDSHMFPLIPVLCYYFKKVIVLDNRCVFNIDFSGYYKDEDVTDCLIAFSENHPLDKFLDINFTTLKHE